MNTKTASPLPWVVDDDCYSIIDASGEYVASELYNEDAEIIVRLVNAAWKAGEIKSGNIMADEEVDGDA